MSSALAREMRRQVASTGVALARVGALRSLTFRSVAPSGANIYVATFERGSLEWWLWLNLDGSVDAVLYREVQK